jgi:hypothetical protein
MSAQTARLLIAGVLFLHGIAHLGALAAQVMNRLGYETGRWATARFWLFPSLAPATATMVAGVFWVVSAIGFVAAAMSFWGVLLPGELWRQLSVASAIVSAVGITLVLGTWPAFNTTAALAVNITVLVALLVVHWPPVGLFGK